MKMKPPAACLILMALILAAGSASADQVKNVALLHGAWVDASG
jgi:hypothetical protein